VPVEAGQGHGFSRIREAMASPFVLLPSAVEFFAATLLFSAFAVDFFTPHLCYFFTAFNDEELMLQQDADAGFSTQQAIEHEPAGFDDEAAVRRRPGGKELNKTVQAIIIAIRTLMTTAGVKKMIFRPEITTSPSKRLLNITFQNNLKLKEDGVRLNFQLTGHICQATILLSHRLFEENLKAECRGVIIGCS
jgi:hypothetical protein